MKKDEEVNIKLPLDRDLFDTIERISQKLGMEPEAWIKQVLQSKIRGNGNSR